MNVQTVTESPATSQDVGKDLLTVLVDTSSGPWLAYGRLVLPYVPKQGARVRIKDLGGQADIKPIVVDGNGRNIDGQSTRSIQNPFEALLLVYTGSQWVVI